VVEPRQIPRERAKDVEASGPGHRAVPLGLTLHPIQDDLVSERAVMTALVDEPGERDDLIA
jgi:hypothetical protein